jgi:3-oxoacyl-[acyl-carrier protein] reductase
VAGPIVFLAGDESRYVTGQVLIVDGGFTCTY